jgi:Bacterial pre-peptidase C-terminal domain/Calx-beta domain/CARDB/Ser-Thr-rich glycosyl-phosphatidyl-inositol-anchored membrane family
MPDFAGNTWATARQLTPNPDLRNVSHNLSDRIDATDPVDLYRFTLPGRGSFNATLQGLSADLNLQVLNSSGGAIASSSNASALTELLNLTLEAGTYYLSVTPATPTAASDYQLNVALQTNSQTDLIWRRGSEIQGWQMQGATRGSNFSLPGRDTNWQLQSTADFNADGQMDLVWRNYATGQDQLWLMGQNAVSQVVELPWLADLNWRLEGAADFNADGQMDLVWRNYRTGQNVAWVMNGPQAVYGLDLPWLGDLAWHLEGVGDFDQDGQGDLIWRNYRTGQNTVWAMKNGRAVYGIDLLTLGDANWRIDGVGDLNGDSNPDLIWRHQGSGQTTAWLMAQTRVTSSVNLAAPDMSWQLAGAGRRFSPPAHVDLAGATAATALNLGGLSGSGSLRDSLAINASAGSLANDAVDYFRFELNASSSVRFNLTGLDGNANLALLTSTEGVLSESRLGGNSPEEISLERLQPGIYYLRVTTATPADQTINYTLNFTGTVAPTILQYNFTYYYNGQNTTGQDYYTGSVYGLAGRYTPGQFYDPTPAVNEAGFNGRYYINSENSSYTWPRLPGLDIPGSEQLLLGKVFLNTYHDVDSSGLTYGIIPPRGTIYDQPVGSNYLGSESGSVGSGNLSLPILSADSQFGGDAQEADFTVAAIRNVQIANTVQPGQAAQITWNGVVRQDAGVNLEVYRGNTLYTTLASNTANDGTETWIPPLTLPAGNDYRIRVVSGATSAVFGFSNYFAVTAPTIVNIDAANSDFSLTETGSGQAANPGRVRLTRTGDLSQSLTVNYTTAGSATSGVDYGSLPGSVTFAPGAASVDVAIALLDDTQLDADETIQLSLTANSRYQLGNNTLYQASIIDNDTTYRYSFTYYYNGQDSTHDYYSGYVFAEGGRYGAFYDFTSALNEAGYNGRYSLSAPTTDYFPPNWVTDGNTRPPTQAEKERLRGQVYFDSYTDVDSSGGIYGNRDSRYSRRIEPIGGNYLGSESSSVGPSQAADLLVADPGFGGDLQEADFVFPYIRDVQIGNTVQPGQAAQITWSGLVRQDAGVNIQVYKGNTLYTTLASNTANDGTETWIPPLTLPVGNDYRIHVASGATAAVFGFSNYFAVTAPAIALPDLVGNSFSLSQSSSTPGASVTAQFRIQNAGTAAGPSRLSFYLSTDGVINNSDRLLGSVDLGNLAANSTTALQSLNLTLPGATDPIWTSGGSYHIGMVVDSLGAIAEANESNNQNQGLGRDFAAIAVTRSQFNIEFDYRFDTAGWFTPARRAALESAADIWESLILDEFADIPVGTTLNVRNPITNTTSLISSTSVIDDLLIFVGATSIDGPLNTTATGGATYYYTSGTSLETRYIGLDLEPWVGTIRFDTAENWFFDATPQTANDIPSGQSDFLSTALHEIGHVLGFSADTNAFNQHVVNGLFSGPNARAYNGGNPLPLTGSHIRDNYTYGNTGETLMDPGSLVGRRVLPTVLDLAVLDDIGYIVNYALASQNAPPA